MKDATIMLRRNSIQAQFNGYYYDFSLAAIQSNSNAGCIKPFNIVDQVDMKAAANGPPDIAAVTASVTPNSAH
jgi:hypothetical protein